MKLLTREEIDCVRRIGRDEEGRRSTIGLTELDALCDHAEFLLGEVEAAEKFALGLGELVLQHWAPTTRTPMKGLPSDWVARLDALRKKYGGADDE